MEKFTETDIPTYVEHQRGFKWFGRNYFTTPDEMINRLEEKKRQYAVDDYLATIMPPNHPVHTRIKFRKDI